jgi:hypothetical protein
MRSYLSWLVISLSTLLLVGCPQGRAGTKSTDASAEAEASAARSDGSGALCGINGQDQCGVQAACDPKLGCVECLGEEDCPATLPRCLQGACVGCRPGIVASDAGPSDCAPGACSTSDYSCHDACPSTACSEGTLCDVASGECLACRDDRDCASGLCSPTVKRCVECFDDASCPGSRPRCRVLAGRCEACISNSDCGRAAPICDPATFTCRAGCSSDVQCPGKQCDLMTARCVDVLDAGAPVDAAVDAAATPADGG